MSSDSSARSLVVRGTEILATDNRQQYREKIARITLDSMVQFVGLLDASGTVLEINKVALDAVGISLGDVEGKPFWTTFWWQVSDEVNQGIRHSIARAAQGEFVRWDTEIYGRASGKETIVIDASLMPVTDVDGAVVFICAEGRDITEKKAQEREIALKNVELQGLLERIRELDEIKTQFFANVSHTNAAKYTPPGGEIGIRASRIGSEIVLSMRDTGIGIAPDVLPRVFELFVQEGQALDRSQGGLGIGLTVVRTLIERHGGSVSAFSDGPGKGSEFIIRLPAAASSEAEIGETAVAAPAGDTAGEANGVAVLIVDDNVDAAEMLAQFVEALGYRVEAALDGPSALTAARRVMPSVALLDIGLPVMDGFEVARRLRATDVHADIRLVAITGYGQEGDRERSRAAGFDAHLVKPVDLEELGTLLSKLTGGSAPQ